MPNVRHTLHKARNFENQDLMRLPRFSVGRDVARERFFCVLLAMNLLAEQTFAFRSSDALSQVEFLIRLLLPVTIILLFRRFQLSSRAQTLLVMYVVLIAYTFVVGLCSERPDAAAINTLKYFYIFAFLIAMLLVLRPKNFSLRFLSIPVVMGGVFAIQTVIVFFGVQSGHPPPSHMIVYARYKGLPVLSYGWLGYGWAIMAAGTEFQLYRAQSFFMEPTRLASFLEAAIFLGSGVYQSTRSKLILICTVLCTISFVLTFSMTSYIVVFCCGFLYIAIRYFHRVGYAAPVAVLLAICGMVGAVSYYLRTAIGFYTASQSAVNMAFGHSQNELSLRIGNVVDTFRFLAAYPFGIGLLSADESSALGNFAAAGDVSAPLIWLKMAGIPGLTVQLAIIGIVARVAVRHVRLGGIQRYIGLAFFANVLHHCLAGNWFDAMFFFLLSSVLVTDAFEFTFPAEATA